MQTIAEALEPLDEQARERVLDWARKKFNVLPATPSPLESPPEGSQPEEYEGFVDLFDAADPKTEPERALVAAHWEQMSRQDGLFTSEQVNALLKDLGRGISNITRTLTQLQNQTPALVRQVSKSGRSQQARKTYKLTVAGTRAIGQMIEKRRAGE
jgi:hypothetical protein